ncbi:MAG: F0F1 ATP synthase subunit A [Terrimicrobiaceae bacterium]
MPLLNLAAALTIDAPNFAEEQLGVSYLEWLTNSIFVSFLVSVAVIVVARKATRQMMLVPGPTQNIFEALVEFLHESIESIVGKHMINKVFGFLVTLFIFILFSNWFALLPGVGSIGWGNSTPAGFEVVVPLLRPTTADLNMTLGMALIFMVLWVYWTFSEVGVRGFLEHTFAPKGGLQGFIKIILIPIFFFVGIIEIVSILFRPMALSLRLFGNVFAGENLLTTMIGLGKQVGLPGWAASLASITLPIPFYFLELLVGLLQATVFTLLCAVYIQLSTSHDEDEEH